ncbi:unnamed protein product [Toxocara canis]|uniref:Ion_trans domain-containing protein n=1 Tax=Toxocara canis TaxID=6265 RepID=A0A183VDI0_TOXCA|nr:unnamed protein product [Toxocara canis]
MEPVARVEYQQRHLRRIIVNPEALFLFWVTVVINIMTAVVFFDQIVAFFIDVYDRNWGCCVSKKTLKRKNLNEFQMARRFYVSLS